MLPWRIRIFFVALAVYCLMGVAPCAYAAAQSAPTTGLEGGTRHSYGPGMENDAERRIRSGGMLDAYGKPILPTEEEKTPRRRLRSGAYGGAPAQPSRPLPPMPETDAGWQF